MNDSAQLGRLCTWLEPVLGGPVAVELHERPGSGFSADNVVFTATVGERTSKHVLRRTLRATFRRKAHSAAMERCLSALLKAEPNRAEVSLAEVTLADLPVGADTNALLRRRAALQLPIAPNALVMVDHLGQGCPPDGVPLALRRARSTRISIEGNAHFCRGLLRTRYPAETLSPTTVVAQNASQQKEVTS